MTVRCAAALASAFVVVLAGCTSFYEIPIETPIQPKMDVSAFQRVLIAGFISGGTDDVDANLETVRLLRTQLRTKSTLRVIDADVLPLLEMAREQGLVDHATNGSPQQASAGGAAPEKANGVLKIRDEKDLEPFETLFANVNLWKKIGEEYQNPLIVTGTILFTPHERAGFVTREQEYFDAVGRRRVTPVRTYMQRKGFILRPKFIFIDGRTGTTLYSESFREEILYSPQQNTPALSSYFELMDRLVPSFLSTLSTQRIRGSRILLK
ncbi:MAG TPA: hypothetical protein VNK41_10215 [Vicinamibacterales bacterium]|nr:hypothetical protein [Vicinamibacterales bacterium]